MKACMLFYLTMIEMEWQGMGVKNRLFKCITMLSPCYEPSKNIKPEHRLDRKLNMYLKAFNIFRWCFGDGLMRSNVGCMLTEIKDMSRKEAIAVGVGGLLIGSAITHGDMIYAMSSIITKAFEIGAGMWQNNITINPDTSKFIVASASPGTVLIYQKNRENRALRKERSRWDIIEDMLKVLTEEKVMKKTRIMQRACLNWRDLQKYFDFLVEENFIAESNNPGAGSYGITEKGRELLKRLKNVKEILV